MEKLEMKVDVKEFDLNAMDEVIRQSNESLTIDDLELHREQLGHGHGDEQP